MCSPPYDLANRARQPEKGDPNMNFSKREKLMQCLPPAADILAVVPVTGADGGNQTHIYPVAGGSFPLIAAAEYVLSCLAEREDKDLRLIRRNAGRQLARRRNIPLPIDIGCVLIPVMMRPVDGRRGTLGYINISHDHVIAPGKEQGADILLLSVDVVSALWQAPTIVQMRDAARGVHWKMIVTERRRLSVVEEYACTGTLH